MTGISMADLNTLNFRVSNLFELGDPGLELAAQCKATVDLLVEKLKPHLDYLLRLHGNEDIFAGAGQSLEKGSVSYRAIFLVSLSDGNLYLDRGGNFIRFVVGNCRQFPYGDCPAGYGSWIFAPNFGLLVMKLEDLLYEGENRTSLMEERMEILTKIVEKYT